MKKFLPGYTWLARGESCVKTTVIIPFLLYIGRMTLEKQNISASDEPIHMGYLYFLGITPFFAVIFGFGKKQKLEIVR